MTTSRFLLSCFAASAACVSMAQGVPLTDRVESSPYALLGTMQWDGRSGAHVWTQNAPFFGYMASITGGHNPKAAPDTAFDNVDYTPISYVPGQFQMAVGDRLNASFYQWMSDFGIPSSVVQQQLDAAKASVANLTTTIAGYQAMLNRRPLKSDDQIKPQGPSPTETLARMQQAQKLLDAAKATVAALTPKLPTYGVLSDLNLVCVSAGVQLNVAQCVRPQIAEVDMPTLGPALSQKATMNVKFNADQVVLRMASQKYSLATSIPQWDQSGGQKVWGSQSQFKFEMAGRDFSTVTGYSPVALVPNALLPAGATRKTAYFLTQKTGAEMTLTLPFKNAQALNGAKAKTAKMTYLHADGSPFAEVTFVNPSLRLLTTVTSSKTRSGLRTPALAPQVGQVMLKCDSVQLVFD